MALQAQLTDLKKLVMKKIGEAATAQNARLISAYSVMATHIEADERTLAALEKRPLEYDEQLKRMDQANLESSQPERITPTDLEQIDGQINGKQLGRVARRKFVEALRTRGYPLEPLRRLGSRIYGTPNGGRVAFASLANELKPDRWWLGVRDAKDLYEAIVLQCCRLNGELLNFFIPKEALVTFWHSLSRNKMGGEVEFNMRKDGESFYLLVHGSADESIDRFRVFYGPSHRRECLGVGDIAEEI